jgi:hypothetical protein
VHRAAVALVTSDNSAHGYNWTFAFPMILFIVIAASLYLVYTRPHKVPGHGALRFTGGPAGAPGSGGPEAPEAPGAEEARAAATAVGFTTAAGGGGHESVHEAAGAHRAADADPASGNVSQDVDQAAADGPGSGPAPAAEESSTAGDPPADDNPATEHREVGE